MLISPAYLEQQKELHQNESYGVASVGYAPLVAQVIAANGVNEVLDYGAGKGRLGIALAQHGIRPRLYHYEPANPRWSDAPAPSEMVACIDVLEHVEPDCLDDVLDDLRRVTKRLGLFTVHTGPAKKMLSDGRNAHLIQEGPAYWLPKFLERFELSIFQRSKGGFFVVVT